MMTSRKTLFTGALALALFTSLMAQAQPHGSELDLTITPVNGAMGGVGTARGFDLIANVFGNPATLNRLETENEFLFAASYVSPNLDLEGTLPAPGGLLGVSGTSSTKDLLLPHAGFAQRFGDRAVLAAGITGISGLGSDWRRVLPQPFGLTADLKVFGAGLAGSYQLTDRLVVGGTFLLGIGSLNVGTVSSSAVVNDFGVAGVAGLTYDTGPLIFGANYKTEMRITYDDVVRPRPNELQDFTLTQPREAVFGVSTTDALFEGFSVEADFRWKNYSKAAGYQSFWRNQWAVAIGGRYEVTDRAELRAGFSFNRSIAVRREALGNSFGSIETLFAPGFPDVGFGADVAPVSPDLIQLTQATIADGLWTKGLTGGFGYQLTDAIRVDVNFQYGFDGAESFISPTSPQVLEPRGSMLSAGFGITWKLGQR